MLRSRHPFFFCPWLKRIEVPSHRAPNFNGILIAECGIEGVVSAMRYLSMLIFVAGWLASPAQAQDAAHRRPDTVTVGGYVTSLYEFDLMENDFTADFWLWYLYRDSIINPLPRIEISNAKEYSFTLPDVENKNGVYYASVKCKAKVKQHWDTRHFPFDEQHLVIWVESGDQDTAEVFYWPDSANSGFQNTMEMDGWKVKLFRVDNDLSRYNTNYGDPDVQGNEAAYPAIQLHFVLERTNNMGLFFKLFTGVFVAFVISYLTIFIKPTDVDPRFGLSVGGLFAAVGNKYIVDNILPDAGAFTLSDKVHALTFAAILLNIFQSVLALYLANADKPVASKWVDRIGAVVLIVVYVIGVWVFMAEALSPTSANS